MTGETFKVRYRVYTLDLAPTVSPLHETLARAERYAKKNMPRGYVITRESAILTVDTRAPMRKLT